MTEPARGLIMSRQQLQQTARALARDYRDILTTPAGRGTQAQQQIVRLEFARLRARIARHPPRTQMSLFDRHDPQPHDKGPA